MCAMCANFISNRLIFFDMVKMCEEFRKAFSQRLHSILADKIEKYGLDDKTRELSCCLYFVPFRTPNFQGDIDKVNFSLRK